MKKQYSIVGAKFRGLDPYLPGIEPGKDVVLVRDPGNRFDPNAIMVWMDGKHVGFLPSKQNAGIAAAMDQREDPVDLIALDAALSPEARDALGARPMLAGKFIRSPNSGFPMVEIDE